MFMTVTNDTFFEVDFGYSKCLQKIHGNLSFLSEEMKMCKCQKLVCNIGEKENYSAHIKSLKLALDNGLIQKKMHKVIQFN